MESLAKKCSHASSSVADFGGGFPLVDVDVDYSNEEGPEGSDRRDGSPYSMEIIQSLAMSCMLGDCMKSRQVQNLVYKVAQVEKFESVMCSWCSSLSFE